ncbi:MAG TPA: hypothetical protein PKD00_07300 [Burkholderiales bacterium]|nr:hypothetical protein [Burkholderiales bacterium]
MSNKEIKIKYKEIESKLPRLLGSLPNVTGWALGKKETEDTLTNTLCITVIVNNKKDVPSHLKVPAFIEGIPTDVIQISNVSFTSIPSSYDNCRGCWLARLANGSQFVYGINDPNGCDNVGCVGQEQDPNNIPNIYNDIQSLQNCNCVDNRAFVYSATGANTDHVVLKGGKSGVPENTFSGACSMPNSNCSACTLGLVARDLIDGKLVMITNHHCFAHNGEPYLRQEDLIPAAPTKITNSVIYKNELNAFHLNRSTWVTPSSLDTLQVVGKYANSPDSIGAFKRAIFVKPGPSEFNKVDAQVIDLKLPNNNSDWVIPLPGIVNLGDGPFPWIAEEEFEDLFLDTPAGEMKIYKAGRSSGTLTAAEGSYIQLVSSTILISGTHRFTEIITATNEIDGTSGTILNGTGDSGGPVLIDKDGELYVIGLLFASGPQGLETYFEYNGQDFYSSKRMTMSIIPIWKIKELLNVDYWDGTVVVNSTDNTIYINGLEFTKTTETLTPITHIKD